MQQIGADPKKVPRDMTEVYGVGAFLMEAMKFIKWQDNLFFSLWRGTMLKLRSFL
jgi:hypothetical protein